MFDKFIASVTKGINKTKCFFGSHDFEWNYISSNSCDQIGKCKREDCNGQEKRVNHEWNEWIYNTSDSCLQTQTCSRCNTQETRTKHDWGFWEYEEENSCREVRYCYRCNDMERKFPVDHNYSEAEYVSEGSCERVFTCERCGRTKDADVAHQWDSESKYVAIDSCERIFTCQRCGEIKEDEEIHMWGVWEYESPTSCHLVTFCRRCYAKADHEKDFIHTWGDWVVDNQTKRWKTRCTHCGAEELGNTAPSPKPTQVVNIHNHDQVILKPKSTRNQIFIDKKGNKKSI